MKLHHLKRTALASLTFLLSAGIAGAQITTDPASLDLILDPGDSESAQIEVCIPGESGVSKADVYIMADTTGSMLSIIEAVKTGATDIVNSLFARPGTDIQIGIGNYKDFPFDPFAFEHQQPVTSDSTSVLNAIAAWSSGGGFDGSEGQLFGLHEIATDPIIGFRPDAKRIIVWFGDAPGHDPICTAISGEASDITEASVTTDLAGAGPGGTVVIAISTITGFALGLNDDPTLSATDYLGFCAIGGTSGQADRLAAASDGLSITGIDSDTIVDAILDAIDVVLTEVLVSLSPKKDEGFEDFVTSITPSEVLVQIPASPDEEVCVVFDVQFDGQDCTENTNVFEGSLNVLLDGAPAGVGVPTTITQPACETMCLLLLGFGPAYAPLWPNKPGPVDYLLVAPPFLTFPVTMDDIPVFPIPNESALLGLPVYTQVMMYNAYDFPADVLQMSNAIEFIVGVGLNETGGKSGITHWANGTPDLGSEIDVGFSIDAWE